MPHWQIREAPSARSFYARKTPHEARRGLDSGLRRAIRAGAGRAATGIILQDDALIPALVTVIVLPLTTNTRRLALPTTVLIPAGEAGLPRDSVALCHQVQVRGKARLRHKLGDLSPDRLNEVCDCLLTTIGL